jgi:hypothetical protein
MAERRARIRHCHAGGRAKVPARPRRATIRAATGMAALLAGVAVAFGPASSGGATTTWVPSTAPTAGLNPPAQPGAYLFATSCGSPSSCVAVGDYPVSGSLTAGDGLIEAGTLAGGGWKWRSSTAPTDGLNPPANTSLVAELDGVSCPSANSCLAVGAYNVSEDGAVGGTGLIEVGTRAGGTWSWAPAAAPTAGLSPPEGASAVVDLDGVTCRTATTCLAVGSYNGNAEGTAGLGLLEVGTLSGGSWTWTPTRAPTTALTPPAGNNPIVTLYGDSCGSSTSCIAVGTYIGTSDDLEGLIEIGTFTGGAWKWKSVNAPTGGLSPPASADPDLILGGVSCPSATTCIAAGYYSYTSRGQVDGVLDVGTRSGASWTWTPSTAPTTGLSPAQKGGDVGLGGVSCGSPTSCVAVGSYNGSEALTIGPGLIEVGQLVDGAWSWAPATAPIAGVSTPAPKVWPLFGVSCLSSGLCVAGGAYTKASGDQYGLIETGTVAA